MKNSQIIEVLRDLGLSDNEAKVYFAALSLGPSTILKVAQAAELKRTTVYSVVESLKLKGLMNVEVKGFKKLFVAENPEKLESILEARRNKFHTLLPEFSAIYNLRGGESFIKYYEGMESIKSIYESFLKELKPHDDYLVISDEIKWIEADEEYFIDYQIRRAKLNLNVCMLLEDTLPAREAKVKEKILNFKIKLLPKNVKLSTNLVVTPKRLLMHQLIPPSLAIVIENRSVIQMHKEMFDIIWNSITG